jgi:hypothetical protein
MCGAKGIDADIWRRLGTNFQNQCTVDIAKLLTKAQALSDSPRFYDLYYVNGVTPGLEPGAQADAQSIQPEIADTPILYPVPVIIQNIPGNAKEAMVLTRRFFALDAQLGRSNGSETATWIQYPSTATLAITVWCHCASMIH